MTFRVDGVRHRGRPSFKVCGKRRGRGGRPRGEAGSPMGTDRSGGGSPPATVGSGDRGHPSEPSPGTPFPASRTPSDPVGPDGAAPRARQGSPASCGDLGRSASIGDLRRTRGGVRTLRFSVAKRAGQQRPLGNEAKTTPPPPKGGGGMWLIQPQELEGTRLSSGGDGHRRVRRGPGGPRRPEPGRTRR